MAMSGPRKSVSYYQNASTGKIHRKVDTDFGPATVTTSDVPVSPDLETFRKAHPGVSVMGEAQVPQRELADSSEPLAARLDSMSDEELAAFGLSRTEPESTIEGGEPEVDEELVALGLTDTGNGWYEASDGEKIRGRSKAIKYAKKIQAEAEPEAEPEGSDEE